MAKAFFTPVAKAELSDIDEYTTGQWGETQADRYLSRFHSHLELLAEMPQMGRKWNYNQSGLRRSEYGQHVIFYREMPGGILVSRILHRSMLPSRAMR